MFLNTVQDFENLRFNAFNSENCLDVIDLSDPDAKFSTLRTN